MSKHHREPIKHTCPDIDKYIKWIKSDIEQDRYLKTMDEKELYDTASKMASRLEDCIGYLEELRNSNDTLRVWGIEEAEKVDSLENYVEELEGKIKDSELSVS